MTVNDLYATTKSIMFEKPSSTVYDDYVLANVNMLLVDIFDENNMCRYSKGKKALTSIPRVTSLEDELGEDGKGIMDEYMYEVLPYGLASKFFIDDDLNKFNIFNTEYNNARVRNQKLISIDVIEEIEAS